MQILRRKVGESIILPGIDVVVTVVRVEGGTVRLGFSAPPGMRILREEIWERSRSTAIHVEEGGIAPGPRVSDH